jgi:hypothetical protein
MRKHCQQMRVPAAKGDTDARSPFRCLRVRRDSRDRLRHRLDQDGRADAPALRADARARVGLIAMGACAIIQAAPVPVSSARVLCGFAGQTRGEGTTMLEAARTFGQVNGRDCPMSRYPGTSSVKSPRKRSRGCTSGSTRRGMSATYLSCVRSTRISPPSSTTCGRVGERRSEP